jgi:hypothetical protein
MEPVPEIALEQRVGAGRAWAIDAGLALKEPCFDLVVGTSSAPDAVVSECFHRRRRVSVGGSGEHGSD